MLQPDLDPPDTPELRKARGAFFTPESVARYVSRWAVRTAGDCVLEPSCGEAAFLLAAHGAQLALAGPARDVALGSLTGHELHEASAAEARRLLAAAGTAADVGVGDFFAVRPRPAYDAVVGNPPFIRYQEFSGASRAASRAAALTAGVSLTGLASSWAAFTVHSALFLRPGGRLGLVLPAELLSVNYAAQVREFLMRRFGRVRLVLFTERIFPGVLEEVVLLLAEGTGGTDHCELLQVQNAEDLDRLATGAESRWTPVSSTGKWTSALMPTAAAAIYAQALGGPGVTVLEDWGQTTLGMVTGNNRFFALSPQRATSLGLQPTDLTPLSPPGSKHLRGLTFNSAMRNALGDDGASTLLFRPSGEPSPAAWAYIRQGEMDGVNAAYKCRVRTPWWRVPLVAPADLLLTYMNSDTPRLTSNTARARHLNSVHGVYLKPSVRELGARVLPMASLNSITVVGAEVVGRAYGGGMLKIEPREADVLPVPSAGLVLEVADALTASRDRVRDHLRAGRLLDAIRDVDRVVLVGGMGMSTSDVAELEQAHAMLMARRRARGSTAADRAVLKSGGPR